jgi:uncharacterized cupin superfamily protein
MVAHELEKAGIAKERMIIEAMGERSRSVESAVDDQAFERCVGDPLRVGHFARQQLNRCQAARSCAIVPPARYSRLSLYREPPHDSQDRRFRRRAGSRHDRSRGRPDHCRSATSDRRKLLRRFHAAIFCRRWSSTPGKWRIRYSESEFCCLIRGRVALENLEGDRWEFGPGAGFVVPAGFEGTWEVIEDCTKFYAIFEPRT